MDNRLEKSTFYRPCERYKVTCRLIPFPPISRRKELRHINTAWLPSVVENGGLSSGFFQDEFLQGRRHFSGWNVCEKQHLSFFLRSQVTRWQIYMNKQSVTMPVWCRDMTPCCLATATLTNCRLSRFLTVGILSNNIGVSLTKINQSITQLKIICAQEHFSQWFKIV